MVDWAKLWKQAQRSFHKFKEALTTATVLRVPEPQKDKPVATDAVMK